MNLPDVLKVIAAIILVPVGLVLGAGVVLAFMIRCDSRNRTF